MQLTLTELQKMCRMFPVGYYIGTDIKIRVVDDTPVHASCCNVKDRTIMISLQQVNSMLKTVDKNEFDDSFIRPLVYHEVSHAFLTDAAWSRCIDYERFELNKKLVKYVMNTIEDARIEIACSTMYYGVNFKQFVKLLNNYNHKKAPSCPRHMLYFIVRFGECGGKGLNWKPIKAECDKVLKKWLHLRVNAKFALSDGNSERQSYGMQDSVWMRYAEDCWRLYLLCVNEFNAWQSRKNEEKEKKAKQLEQAKDEDAKAKQEENDAQSNDDKAANEGNDEAGSAQTPEKADNEQKNEADEKDEEDNSNEDDEDKDDEKEDEDEKDDDKSNEDKDDEDDEDKNDKDDDDDEDKDDDDDDEDKDDDDDDEDEEDEEDDEEDDDVLGGAQLDASTEEQSSNTQDQDDEEDDEEDTDTETAGEDEPLDDTMQGYHGESFDTTIQNTDGQTSIDDSDSCDDDANQPHDNMPNDDPDDKDNDVLSDHDIDKTLADNVAKGLDQTMHEIFAVDNAFYNAIKQLLDGKAKRKATFTGGMRAYSGSLDPRAVGRSDWKIFVKASSNGDLMRFSRIKLNLFCDCSGSYWLNVYKTNLLLAALKKLEMQDKSFTFDMVACGDGECLLDKSNRFSSAYSGTHFDERMLDIYKSLQDKNAMCYNILLVDGEDGTSYGSNKFIKVYTCFNKPTDCIITDDSNAKHIKDQAPKCQIIVNKADSYADQLTQQVLQVLQSAMAF